MTIPVNRSSMPPKKRDLKDDHPINPVDPRVSKIGQTQIPSSSNDGPTSRELGGCSYFLPIDSEGRLLIEFPIT